MSHPVKGKREYIQVLRLLECFPMAVVERAVREALRLQAISFDGVKQGWDLVLCGIEGRPARLDLQHYPHLPETQVAITAASDYLSLLTQLRPGLPLAEAVSEGGR